MMVFNFQVSFEGNPVAVATWHGKRGMVAALPAGFGLVLQLLLLPVPWRQSWQAPVQLCLLQSVSRA